MKTKLFCMLCMLFFFLITDTTKAYAKDRGFRLRVAQSPLKLKGGALMHYYDGVDDYYPQTAGGLKAMEYSFTFFSRKSGFGYGVSYIPGDIEGLGLFIEQVYNENNGKDAEGKESKNKKSEAVLGWRLGFLNLNGNLGSVPIGNNSARDFMYAPCQSCDLTTKIPDNIQMSSKFEMKTTIWGGDIFVRYDSGGFFLETGYRWFSKPKFNLKVKDSVSGKEYEIPWSFNYSNGQYATSSGTEVINTKGVYFGGGITF